MNESAIWFSNAGINIATDIVILILPLFVLRGLMMPIRTKIWLALILSLGGLYVSSPILYSYLGHRSTC